jgi:Ferritin-like domain
VETTEYGESRTATRRRVLQAIGLGGALAAVPVAPQLVGAQPQAVSPDAPPNAPTESDRAVLSIAQMAELATVELYNAILSDFDDADWAPVLAVFREHHEAYADAIGTMLGGDAPNVPADKLLATFADAAGEPPLGTLAAVEQSLSSTHTTLLGALEGVSAAALIASIIPAEARHATALGLANGAGLADLIPSSGLDDLESALAIEDIVEV